MRGATRNKDAQGAPGRLDVYAFRQLDLVDVTVVVAVNHPCTAALVPRACRQAGHAAGVAEGEKLRGYRVPTGEVITYLELRCLAVLKSRPKGGWRIQNAASNRSRF